MNFGKLIGAAMNAGRSASNGASDAIRSALQKAEMANYSRLVKNGEVDKVDKLYPTAKPAMNFGRLVEGGRLNTEAQQYMNALEKEISDIDDALLKSGSTQKLKEAEAKLRYIQQNNLHGTPEGHDAFSEYLRYSDKDPLYRRKQDIQRKLKNYQEHIGIILDDGRPDILF